MTGFRTARRRSSLDSLAGVGRVEADGRRGRVNGRRAVILMEQPDMSSLVYAHRHDWRHQPLPHRHRSRRMAGVTRRCYLVETAGAVPEALPAGR
jgi:hypothetical protein